jgi:hypothetical protein
MESSMITIQLLTVGFVLKVKSFATLNLSLNNIVILCEQSSLYTVARVERKMMRESYGI